MKIGRKEASSCSVINRQRDCESYGGYTNWGKIPYITTTNSIIWLSENEETYISKEGTSLKVKISST